MKRPDEQKCYFGIRVYYLICLVLIIATLYSYWQVKDHDFVNFDDNSYVTDNPFVKDGLTKKNVKWAFTAVYKANWHPVTWLSHMLDVELYGINAGQHHLTNVIFHMLNSILLFYLLLKMTGAAWQSGFVAVLFAVHPLHVESVAWVAERKDVLSAFFFMLTICSYIWYVKKPEVYRYVIVSTVFILGLMSKAMVVTLPFVLLLFDYWPLQRFQKMQAANSSDTFSKIRAMLPLVLEKIPLLILSASLSVITIIAQQKGGALAPLDRLPIIDRLGNALISYISYIGKMVWPLKLAVFYPYPEKLDVWNVLLSLILLVSISFIATLFHKKMPYLTTGWCWYLVTLVPVLGVVQVGLQRMADRYTYIPLIGLFIASVWGVSDLFSRWRHKNIAITLGSIITVSFLIVTTQLQVRYWVDTMTLFKHALHVTDKNYVAHKCIGNELTLQHNFKDAFLHYSEALAIKPDYAPAHFGLGVFFEMQNKTDLAIQHYLKTLHFQSNHIKSHHNLGNIYTKRGDTTDAIYHYCEAIRINPNYLNVHNNLGVIMARRGDLTEAAQHFKKELQINPNNHAARNNLAKALELIK